MLEDASDDPRIVDQGDRHASEGVSVGILKSPEWESNPARSFTRLDGQRGRRQCAQKNDQPKDAKCELGGTALRERCLAVTYFL